MYLEEWQETLKERIEDKYDRRSVPSYCNDYDSEQLVYLVPLSLLIEHQDNYPKEVRDFIEYAQEQMLHRALAIKGLIPNEDDLYFDQGIRLKELLKVEVQEELDDMVHNAIFESDSRVFEVCFIIKRIPTDDGDYEYVNYYNVDHDSYAPELNVEWDRDRNLRELQI